MLSGKNLYRLHLPLIQTESKIRKKNKDSTGGKKFFPKSCSIWTRHTHNSLRSVCQPVKKVKISRCLNEVRAERLVYLSDRKAGISGRKCLIVSENCKQLKQERVDAFEVDHPTPNIRQFPFTYTAALRYVNFAHANSFNTVLWPVNLL
jgi:hypothetical protein